MLVDLAQDYELLTPYYSTEDWQNKSTYTDKLPLDINADTGRIHTSYQAVAATGGCPRQTQICRIFPFAMLRDDVYGRPSLHREKSHYGVGLLPDRLENNGPLVGDAGLHEAFAEDQDIHRATAAEVFDRGWMRSRMRSDAAQKPLTLV